MEASSPQTEVLDDVEDLHRLLDVADFGLLRDDQVDVHVGVNEVAVRAALHGPFDPHEAVFLRTGRADRSASSPGSSSQRSALLVSPTPQQSSILLLFGATQQENLDFWMGEGAGEARLEGAELGHHVSEMSG